MTDKRNIVIKVKYPVSGKAAENLAPKMITEWNVKRILLVVGALFLILASLLYVITKDTQQTDSDNVAAVVDATEKQAMPQLGNKDVEIKNLDIPKQVIAEVNPSYKPVKELNKDSKPTAGISVKETTKQLNKKTNKDPRYSEDNHTVSRASLTYGMDNKEPIGELVGTIDVRHKKPVWVYYFTELKTMKGNKVYHEWLRNGEVVSRQALVISGDIWRTSSRKLLSDSEKGNWTVRLVDKNGRLLNKKEFKVE